MATVTQGQSFTDTAGRTGIVNFDPNTGKKLAAGQTVSAPTLSAPLSTPISTKVTPSISAQEIGNSPIAVPQQVTSNQALSNLSLQNAVGSIIPTTVSQSAPTTSDARSSILQRIMGAQTQLENKSGRSMEIQNEEQVFQKEAEAKRLSDQMVALDKWYRDDTEKTRQTFGGTTSGLVAEVNRKTREYESQRADLAIQANLAQDNYESAYRIAQAKIESEFEPIQQSLDYGFKLYDMLANDMTESEKFQAQAILQEKQAQADRDFALLRDKTLHQYNLSEIYAREAAANTYASSSDDLLSVSEAKSLGVPYGTTRSQAIGKRSLTASEQESQINANSALLSLQNLTKIISNDDGSFNKTKLITPLGLGEAGQPKRELRDVITRIRTGAALSKNEESFYNKQIPQVTDSDTTIQNKINQLAAFYAGLAGSPVTLQQADGTVVVADDMYNPQTRLEVRQAIAGGSKVIAY